MLCRHPKPSTHQRRVSSFTPRLPLPHPTCWTRSRSRYPAGKTPLKGSSSCSQSEHTGLADSGTKLLLGTGTGCHCLAFSPAGLGSRVGGGNTHSRRPQSDKKEDFQSENPGTPPPRAQGSLRKTTSRLTVLGSHFFLFQLKMSVTPQGPTGVSTSATRDRSPTRAAVRRGTRWAQTTDPASHTVSSLHATSSAGTS